jgi:solute carrier family 35 protein
MFSSFETFIFRKLNRFIRIRWRSKMLHVQSALLYGIMSTGMVFANKILLTKIKFNFPIVIIFVEMCIHFSVISLLGKMQVLKNIDFNIIKMITSTEKKNHGKYLVLSVVFYILHSLSALKALSKMNIPMYVIFKRCVPFANLILSYFLFDKNPFTYTSNSIQTVTSILLMTLGVIIAGLGDLTFDLSAYLYCSFSVICQAMYFSCIQKSGESQKNPFQLLLVSSVIAVPTLFTLTLVTGELQTVINTYDTYLKNPMFFPSFLLVVSCGVILCFSQFWCTISNNAITTSVIGVLKSTIQTYIGWLFDTTVFLGVFGIVGILMNLICGTWYTYLMYMAKSTNSTNSLEANIMRPNTSKDNLILALEHAKQNGNNRSEFS